MITMKTEVIVKGIVDQIILVITGIVIGIIPFAFIKSLLQ